MPGVPPRFRKFRCSELPDVFPEDTLWMLGQAVHESGVGDAQDHRCGRSAVWLVHLLENDHLHNSVASGNDREIPPDPANGGADCEIDGDCWRALDGGVLLGPECRGELQCVHP